jgi:hypothetical protein
MSSVPAELLACNADSQIPANIQAHQVCAIPQPSTLNPQPSIYQTMGLCARDPDHSTECVL